MQGVLVALDLETTGLDTQADAIIEIGAVKIENGVITDTFSTLINPGIDVPAQATYITGIHSEDLVKAPTIRQALPDLVRFVGDLTIIGHNIGFDMAFLNRHEVLLQNHSIDTFELASILLPAIPRYDLNSLASHFGIALTQHHRALDDAQATGELYWHLWQELLKLPLPILQEICSGMVPFPWDTGLVFQAARDHTRAYPSSAAVMTPSLQPLMHNDYPPLQILSTPPQAVDSTEITKIFSANGQLQQHIGEYEIRQEQVNMADLVTDAFNNKEQVLIEAGTGTGKTLAYLVPAAQWAVQNQQQVVISTNTLNLQDQLLNHDVPIVSSILEQDFQAAVLKGRSNYLCPRRLTAARRKGPTSLEELKTLAKILIWLQTGGSGERSEISLRFAEHSIWNRLSAEDEDCSTQRCIGQMSGMCPYFKAHQKAHNAHLVITNHALLINDAMSGHHVLPEYHNLIIDEAHQLEDAITSGLTFRIDLASLQRRIADLGNLHNGLLGDLIRGTRNRISDKQFIKLERFVQDISGALQAMKQQTNTFFLSVFETIQPWASPTNYKIKIDDRKRKGSDFSYIRQMWENLDEYFEVIATALAQLAGAITKLDADTIPDMQDHISGISAAAHHFADIRTYLQKFSLDGDANMIFWVNNGVSAEEISIHIAPLHVGKLMTEHIWNKKDCVILTSATLQTANSFDYVKERLSANSLKEIALGSPFDYRQSSLVFSVTDIPAPNEQGFQKALERGIIELAAALGGRLLVLFTSYQQLRETAANITPRLALGNIMVFDQASGTTRDKLVTNFKSAEKAVLLGTRSFWEGIDIPGDDLSAIIITRLPFTPPTDPIFAARSEAYTDHFADYAVPDAILRFRQGFGRLIRTRTDRGVVAIFDNRIIRKAYGAKFLESLPDVTLKTGRLDELPEAARTWLDKK